MPTIPTTVDALKICQRVNFIRLPLARPATYARFRAEQRMFLISQSHFFNQICRLHGNYLVPTLRFVLLCQRARTEAQKNLMSAQCIACKANGPVLNEALRTSH